MTKKVKKKKLNIKRTLAFLLFIYIFCYIVYFLISRPIRHIEITGNEYVLDSEILRVSKLKDYPSFLKYSNNRIEKSLKNIKFIDEVEVKKWFNYTIKINIKENKPLFYYKEKVVLSNGNIINNDMNNVYGIPIFQNNLNSDLLNKFIENFKVLDDNIIYEMDTIEYYPLKNDKGKIVTKDRFKIVMNDGNNVIVNTKSLSVINKYNDIYSSLGDRKGIINLDTNEIKNLIFLHFEE